MSYVWRRPKHRAPKFSKKGGLFTKTVTIRIIPPPPFKEQRHHIKAHRGNHYEESHVEDVLATVVDRIENQFSKWEFRMVQLGPDQFNFIVAGEKTASTAHASKMAAQILKELQEGHNESTASAVPVPQEGESVEDRHNPEGEQE